MINVTKTYLPPFEEYLTQLRRAWDTAWITNNGKLVQELEQKLREYLGLDNILFTNNGTVVLQMALKALEITKEVITTPFSYVATTNAILWERCTPRFVDIDSKTFCIDADKIESSITENTEAILTTHVYGFPCEVEKIQEIARRNKLKVIYDGAHAFGCVYKGKSLLSYGDISTCSFHATKLFHTVEGGAIVCNNENVFKKLMLYRQFGHIGEDYLSVGINGKNSEFHAAMGLTVLPKLSEIIDRRKSIVEVYDRLLTSNEITRPMISPDLEHNYSYYPIVFKSEGTLIKVINALKRKEIFARRYFYPSLNELPFLKTRQICEVSESISRRVLTLPLFFDLEEYDIEKIAGIVNEEL